MNTSLFRILAFLLFGWTFSPPIPAAGESPLAVPEVRLPLMAHAPTIDGQVEEKEWQDAARMERFGWGPMLSPHEASFWVGCDGKEIFFAVVSETPPGGKLLASANPMPQDGDARTWSDDSIELILDPLHTEDSNRRRIYHANLNSKGAINDTAYLVGGGGEAWRGKWRIANRILGDRWHFEAALPLKDMGVTDADLAKPFGIRICRDWQQSVPPHQTEWGARQGAFLMPETMPIVIWDPRAPVVQVLQLTDPGASTPRIRMTIRNPGKTPIPVVAHLEIRPKNSAPSTRKETPTVAPGQTVEVEVSGPALNEDLLTRLEATSPEGDKVFYRREFTWRSSRPETVWTLDEGASKRVACDLVVYPSHNLAMINVNLSGWEDRDQVRGGKARFRPAKGGSPLASAPLPPFREHVALVKLPLPSLPGGDYVAEVELEGVKTDPIRIPYTRHVMPWEKNTLGKSDALVPPFTPIAVEGRQVATVLRVHDLDEMGLFRQIRSLDKPLLKGPMRLEATVNGKTVAAQGRALKFVEHKPTRAVSEASWSAGALSGTSRGEWDYDGLLKWTLQIQPARARVDALTLVIPLDNQAAPLFHACTDGLRFNYAGFTPEGEGRIWDGTKAARNSILGSYVPYIWLGAEERGFAVFGENDQGWVTSADVPCQEIVRQGDTLELRLHLIATPTTLASARQIVLGFQATPVKPMPEGWRRWTMGTARSDTWNLSFVGSCYSWGAPYPCLDVYPMNEDFRVWEQYKKAKETGTLDETFVKEWIRLFDVFPEKQRKELASHNRSAFDFMKRRPKNVLVYTNARGVRFDTPEGQTFLNEWHRDRFPKRDWKKEVGAAYDLNPCESFRDYALWYYKKMFDTFVDAIYWDDIFLQSCFHPDIQEGYFTADGQIQPMAGLWDMRELIRRTAILCHELGKTNANMPHITNTAMAPVLAFAGTHYTWEDRTGEKDFQDRFPRDYLRAESIGLQCGNVPFGMLLPHGLNTEKQKAHFERTATGPCLTHEIKVQGGPWGFPVYFAMMDHLFNYGYGLPAVRVWRYWEAGHPVSVSGIDASTLVCSKPGSALVVVSDWANGGKARLKLDRAALGLQGDLKATDLEAKKPLPVEGEVVPFDIPKHDFKLILIEETQPHPA